MVRDCFHSLFSDSVGPAAASRSEVKTAGRRTSAPPVVNTQSSQQRALLREKSKENQLDRNGCQQQDKDSDKSCFDIGQYHTVRCLLRKCLSFILRRTLMLSVYFLWYNTDKLIELLLGALDIHRHS